MQVAVLGGGALGSVLAARLAGTEHDVTLVDRSADHVAAVRDGLRLDRPDGPPRAVSVPATTDSASVGAVDLLVLAVKSYDTASAMADAAPLCGDDTDVLTLQNGLGNAETIAGSVPEERVVAGTTAHGATFVGPGHVRHAGTGPTRVGRYFVENDDGVRAVAATLGDAGFETTVVGDVRDALWRKVAVNAGINAATALARVDNGAMATTGPGERLLERAVSETVAVARAAGRDPGDDVVAEARSVARDTAENVSSMRADVVAERRTEVDAINGAVVDRAAECGVPAPVNSTLADLVRLATAD
jgi:2-dehydropantoate 2-reductase